MLTNNPRYYNLADLAVGRDNNYNLIRFVAALLVLVSHSVALCMGPEVKEPFEAIGGMTLGNVAVDVFFFSSGFLVTGSLIKRAHLPAFLAARLRRIMPGLLASVVLCVFVVGWYFTEESNAAYFQSKETWRFVAKNSLMLGGAEFDLPGVFASNPYSYVVNGSLWTLPQEVRLYLLLALVGSGTLLISRWIRPFTLKRIFTLIAVLLVLGNTGNHFFHILSREALHVASMFFFGAAVYVNRDRVNLSKCMLLGCVLVMAVSIINHHLFFVLYQFLLPWTVLGLAYLPSGRIRLFNKLGDYSYGLYLYAFPIQQSLVAVYGIRSPWVMGCIAFLITIILAIVSWHFMEKPILKSGQSKVA